MGTTHTHYSHALSPKEMSASATEGAKRIRQLMTEKQGHVAFVFRGLSGTAFASAVALKLFDNFGVDATMIYVRKNNENSHGAPVERPFEKEDAATVFVVVDDFVATGDTVRECQKGLDGYITLRDGTKPKISYALLSHDHHEGTVDGVNLLPLSTWAL